MKNNKAQEYQGKASMRHAWMDRLTWRFYKNIMPGLLMLLVSLSSHAAELNFHHILQQERSWAGLSSKKLKVNEIEWSYSEGGDLTKPTLLLLHGLSGTWDNWNRVARYLTPH